MKILITGATGFIGAPTLKALASQGHEMFALTRSERGSGAIGQYATCVRGDLEDPSSVEAAIVGAGPEAVVHLAARIASTRSDAALHKVNAEGTQAVFGAAIKANARRFVFTSTVVTGDAEGRVLTEDAPLPVLTSYGRAKQDSEQRLLARSGDIEVVILRPSHVYGPGGWFEGIVRHHARGRFFIPGSGENLWDLVHVDDVVQALVLASTKDAASTIYHVVDDTPTTLNRVLELISEALGRRPPRHVPVWFARMVAGRNAVDAAIRSARSSNRRIREELGWAPKYPDSAAAIGDVVREIMARAT